MCKERGEQKNISERNDEFVCLLKSPPPLLWRLYTGIIICVKRLRV